MKYLEALYLTRKELDRLSEEDLKTLSLHHHLDKVPNVTAQLAVKILEPAYHKARMVPVSWGSLDLDYINAKYNNLADRFQEWANEVGIGGTAPRAFQAQEIIEWAIQKGITNKTIDEIIAQQMAEKFATEEEETYYPKSLAGRQCISNCYLKDGACLCDTKPYQGWLGQYNWDMCSELSCKRGLGVRNV